MFEAFICSIMKNVFLLRESETASNFETHLPGLLTLREIFSWKLLVSFKKAVNKQQAQISKAKVINLYSHFYISMSSEQHLTPLRYFAELQSSIGFWIQIIRITSRIWLLGRLLTGVLTIDCAQINYLLFWLVLSEGLY